MSKAAKLLSVVLCMWSVSPQSSAGQFVEEPQTVNVPAGGDAVFRCRHSDTDFYGWTINGVSAARSNVSHDVQSNQLTILGLPEYNGSVIECLAFFTDGTPSQTSRPAMLIVQGVQTSSPIPTTSPGVQTFILSPTSKNVALDTIAVFQCRHPTTRVIEWIINGTLVQESSPGISSTTSGDTSTLSIIAGSEFNSTEIHVQCEAFFRDAPSQLSDTAIMMIQGKLSNVTNLVRVNSTTISWEPPLSLDLTNVDPDIVYCVEVYNVTDCEKRELLTGDCNVTVTNYIIPNRIEFGQDDIYEYIVTPRSNVAGSVNGTASLPLKSHPLRFTMYQSTLTPKNETKTDYTTELLFDEDDLPVLSTYSLLLEPEDGMDNGKGQMRIAKTTLNEARRILSLRVSQLNRARLWRCLILAYGCRDHSLALWNQSEVYLSTHDIQGVNVTSPQPGELSVDGYFIEGSTASGVLVIATDGSNISYHFIDRDSDRLNGDTRVLGLPGGECIVSVFVMKEDGLPVERAAAIPTDLTVANNGTANSSSLIDYSNQSNSTHVCITCTFLESSTATDCVAVVHQRISQLNSRGLMNIESSHKFTRSNGTFTAYGCIDAFNPDEYQVGVIGGRLVHSKPGTTTDPTNTSTSTFVGVIVSVVIVVSLAVVAAVLSVIVIWNWKSPKSHTQKDGPAPPNTYEPALPTNNPSVPLVNRVLSDGGNYDTIIDMAGAPPPSPLYSTLSRPGTARPTGVGVVSQVNKAMYSTPAEVSDTVSVPVATDEQVNHPDIKHEEINGDLYAVANKPKKESKSSGDAEGNKKPLVYSKLADVDPSVRAPPTTDDPVAYSTVQHEKGENGDQSVAVGKQESGGDGSVDKTVKESKGSVIYSTPELKRPKVSMPLDDDCVEYAKVEGTNGQTMSPRTTDPGMTGKCHHTPPPLPVRFTVDNLLPLLHPVSSKWRELSECMSLNEELIDEIDTNNETDKPCLQSALGWYMKNGDLKHTWEEIVAILKKMDEFQLADKIYNLHVHPYIVLLPGETQPTEERQHQHSHSSSDSGIGNSDSDSNGSTPPSSSDDEESVQQSETALEPVASTPVQQQTTDLEQRTFVHQASDGSTLVRPTRTYGEASLTFLGDKQVVGTVSDPTRTGDQGICQGSDGLAPVVSHFQSRVATSRSHENVSDETVEPEVPSEAEQTDYMELLSRCNSTTLHLSQSECVRLLRRRRTMSNHESDELWQNRAKAYYMLSESCNSKDQEEVVTAGKCEDTKDNVTKNAMIYVVFFQVKLRVTIRK